jgi:hypothetical protein
MHALPERRALVMMVRVAVLVGMRVPRPVAVVVRMIVAHPRLLPQSLRNVKKVEPPASSRIRLILGILDVNPDDAR